MTFSFANLLLNKKINTYQNRKPKFQSLVVNNKNMKQQSIHQGNQQHSKQNKLKAEVNQFRYRDELKKSSSQQHQEQNYSKKQFNSVCQKFNSRQNEITNLSQTQADQSGEKLFQSDKIGEKQNIRIDLSANFLLQQQEQQIIQLDTRTKNNFQTDNEISETSDLFSCQSTCQISSINETLSQTKSEQPSSINKYPNRAQISAAVQKLSIEIMDVLKEIQKFDFIQTMLRTYKFRNSFSSMNQRSNVSRGYCHSEISNGETIGFNQNAHKKKKSSGQNQNIMKRQQTRQRLMCRLNELKKSLQQQQMNLHVCRLQSMPKKSKQSAKDKTIHHTITHELDSAQIKQCNLIIQTNSISDKQSELQQQIHMSEISQGINQWSSTGVGSQDSEHDQDY